MAANEFNFSLSEDEKIVRTYECTRLLRLFSPTTTGYLTVTNKRVVYHSEGKSIQGTSALVAEIPMNDVSGLSMSVTSSFNLFGFLVFSFILYWVSQILSSIFPDLFYNWAFPLLLIAPFAVAWMFEKNIISEDAQKQFLQNVQPITKVSFLADKGPEFYSSLFSSLFYIGLVILGWHVSLRVQHEYGIPFGQFAVLLAVYFYIYRQLFGKRRTFSLAIGSKASKDSGIFIPGSTTFSIFGRETSAIESINAAPSIDAERVIHELGAMITDIQQLGDRGIKKWTS